MKSRAVRSVAAVTVALTVTALVPAALVTSSSAAASKTLARDSFERSLARWSPTSAATRLDRVRFGRGKNSAAARLRPPSTRAATVGMTDAPGLVRSSHFGVRYAASVWVRATPDAHRSRPLRVRVTIGERNSTGLGVHAWRTVGLSATRWRQVTVPFTARHHGRRLDVSVRALDLPRGGALLVDDVRVLRVPKPHASNRRLAGVRFGASVDEGRLEWPRALKHSDRRFSRIEVVRYFEPFIRDSWSGHLGRVRRPATVSFSGHPQHILSGAYDRTLRKWFHDAPNRVPIWWTYSHEPEDDIARGDFSAKRYRQAWRHINSIARRAGTPNLHPTLVLMAWTARSQSGRSVKSYYPGDFIDVMAWDGYNPPGTHSYAPPREVFGAAAARSKKLGNRFAIAELGSVLVPGDDGSRRATWLVNVAKFAASKNAAFVTYWDAKIPGENYQLRDVPSKMAWRIVVKD